MSSDWPEVRVEEIASGDSNALSTGPFGSAIGSRFFASSGVPVIRGSNLSADVGVKLIDENLVFVSVDKAKEFRRSIAKRGDLVFTCWGTINQIGLIHDRSKYPEYVVSNKQMKLTVDPKRVDSKFLYYVFSNPEKQQEILSNGIGAAVPGFNLGQLKRHAFRLPPLVVQQGIVKVLDSLDAKIDLNRRVNQTLEAMAQAIFKSWFVDFDPVKAKIAAKAEGRDPLRAAMTAISGKPDAELDTLPPDQFAPLAATAALFPDEMEDSELGEIPKGWVATPLDGVANFLNGLALQKFPPESTTEYLPVIKIAQLRAGRTQGADRAAKFIKPEYVVQDGDVLFSWSGSLEVDIWTGGAGALNQHLFKVTSQHQPKWFYFLATRHHLPQFREIAANKATTMGHIQRKHLSDALIAVAPAELMSRATELIEPLVNEMIAARLQSRELAVIRDALLPKLLSGELVVPTPVSLAVAEDE